MYSPFQTNTTTHTEWVGSALFDKKGQRKYKFLLTSRVENEGKINRKTLLQKSFHCISL